MALAAIEDILANFPGWTTEFKPQRMDEVSRKQSGATIIRRRGSPLWTLTAVSIPLLPNALDRMRARLEALEGGDRLFWGYSLSRCYPIAYPKGTWPTGPAFNGLTATLSVIGSDNKSLRISGLPNGFKFSVGDMVSFQYGAVPSYALHRIEEDVSAAFGTTPPVEVFPHFRLGVATGVTVRLYQPRCLMMIVPGSISTAADAQTGKGSVSFQGLQVPNA